MTLTQKYGIAPDLSAPPMAMDERHIEALHQAVLTARPLVVAEIGSYKGHSTVAFLEAMEHHFFYLHLFEPYPTPELLALIHGRLNVHLHTTPIWQSPLRPDFVFIDGDHGVPALADLAFCLARGVRTIAMHDTNGHSCGLTPFGSEAAACLLKEMPDRDWVEDLQQRHGEWTQRGFGISTKRKP